MLGTSTFVPGRSGDGGTSPLEGGGGRSEALVGPPIMTEICDDDKPPSGAAVTDLFEGDRCIGGNRWPRQETIALIKIRSDMDVIFRDSSLKGPLWEEVSRKMAELGYHRSGKKCKEKFENVYKYHKRTKDGRVGKADGKTYRFFDELEALEQHHLSFNTSSSLPPPLPQVKLSAQSQAPPQAAVPVSMIIPAGINPVSVTVPSSSHPISVVHTSSISPTPEQQTNVNPIQIHNSIQMENPGSPSATQSSSSSTSSDEEVLGRRKRKRKWKDFFDRLMNEVIDKQEELQKKFLEAVEKREHDRVAREEAWKIQEMARLNRENDILVQERSVAAAKDAALIAFLQKLSDQQQIPMPLPIQAQTQAQAQPQLQPPQPQPQPQQPQIITLENPLPSPTQSQTQLVTQLQTPPHLQQPIVVANTNNGDNVELQKAEDGDNLLQASSSRWPKAEVQALINLRTNLDQKYQDNGPKGPLWEEISASMKKLGYNRNSKRCKEKWENINKYFKKVKESSKKRHQDSKTCPYFDQLDALYREKSKVEIISTPINTITNPASRPSYGQPQLKHEGASMAAIMAEPEQQWPPLTAHSVQIMEDQESENQDDSEDDGDEEDDDDQGSGYEIVANNNK